MEAHSLWCEQQEGREGRFGSRQVLIKVGSSLAVKGRSIRLVSAVFADRRRSRRLVSSATSLPLHFLAAFTLNCQRFR